MIFMGMHAQHHAYCIITGVWLAIEKASLTHHPRVATGIQDYFYASYVICLVS